MPGRNKPLRNKPKIKKGSRTREGPYEWIAPYGSIWRFHKGFSSPFDTDITWPNKQYEDFRDRNDNTFEKNLPLNIRGNYEN